jgi:tight adherence protein B
MAEFGLGNLIGVDLLIAYGALAIGMLLLVDGLYQVAASRAMRAEARVNRRLNMLASGNDPREVLARLRRAKTHRLVEIIPPLAWIDRMMRHAGMTLTLPRLGMIMFAVAGGAYFALRFASLAFMPSVLAAIGIGIALPVFYILRLRKKRMNRFIEQFPDALDLLVRSLRVGHPLSAALSTVAEELPDPVGTEMGIVVDEMTYGLDLREAVEHMNDRVPVDDLHYFSVAVQIQHGTGGNMAEVLDGLAKIIRGRLQFFRKVRSVTAHGRMVSIFATLVPPLSAVGMYMVMPDLYENVLDHPSYPYFLAGGFFLCILNYLVMRQMVAVKV